MTHDARSTGSFLLRGARTGAAVLAALVVSGAGGCAQRSLVAVRESGDNHYKRGEYDAAVTDYLEYQNRAPGRAEVHHMLGRTYLAQGRTAQAREQLMLAHTLRVEDDEILRSLAEGLYADKQFDELNRLLRARTVDRGRMEDYLLLAEYAQKQGDVDTERSALTTAARVDGGMSPAPQLALARMYHRAGDREQAVQRLRMAYFAEPTNGEVIALAREWGQVTGPTWGIPPAERAGGGEVRGGD